MPEKPQIPPILTDLADSVFRHLKREGLKRDKAKRMATDIVREFSEIYAGEQIYVPVSFARLLNDVDRSMLEEFENGATPQSLMRKYGYSYPGFYKAIRRARRLSENDAQLKLID